jgi:hypothetical protein
MHGVVPLAFQVCKLVVDEQHVEDIQLQGAALRDQRVQRGEQARRAEGGFGSVYWRKTSDGHQVINLLVMARCCKLQLE